MANVVEYGAPIYIAYSAEGHYTDKQIDVLDELIEITPVIFDSQPVTADLAALPDKCRIEVKTEGAYFLCIASDTYGSSAAKVGVPLAPCYMTISTNAALLTFYPSETSTGMTVGSAPATEYAYLYVYKEPDGRGYRLARGGIYSLRPGYHFATESGYDADKVAPGDYVAFEGAPTAEEEPATTTITYNGNEIASLEAGQTATIKTAECEVEHDIIITPAFPINIAYGDIIATAEAGQTATIKCANTEVDFDIVVSAKAEEESGNYLTFSSPSSFTLKTYNGAKNWDGALEYSTDTSTWNTWSGATISADGGKLYLRGIGNTKISAGSSGQWVLSGSNIACNGNIENLLDYASVANGEHPTMGERCYDSMFKECTSLTEAPDLLALTIPLYGYQYMFYGCTSLTKPPKICATTASDMACYYMFAKCTSLVKAPELPFTILGSTCCEAMFYNCTNLEQLPKLHSARLPWAGYQMMFYGCKKIKLSKTQTDEYKTEYRIPTTDTGTEGNGTPLNQMFENTGGTFTGTPSINTTYFTSNEVV
jgi:hypothetical protein